MNIFHLNHSNISEEAGRAKVINLVLQNSLTENSRKRAEKLFFQNVVIKKYLQTYNYLLLGN